MSEILQDVQRKLVFPIDFPSQRKTEKFQQLSLMIGALVACILGFAQQSLKVLLIAYGISCVITLICVLPAYPWYNKQKLRWAQPKIEINVDQYD
ncbi:CDG_1a_G0029970.mRNA.1.CDS.1 [Saccharomyces cerevisiae]|nr:CFA_G0029670.mRNA.1.CDS.1 [Saccharomyces cerevisiae]CAI4563924.1 CDG_1a_G0029970.mRNA.1.CDS.1 [Saccharomyces cerevisiae]CAI4568376.1 BBL_G0029600.mRNA.1.CDS.1 [Saccharomyces cerevisiae]CAI7179938.1 BBL_G0029600.mRNA.1.CDS.1 [Saccharomyces cerevisiae]CAI7358730.1 CFA_G0029670.mRNA.1.CDS.1 [Saccharomyces cerevisiae]